MKHTVLKRLFAVVLAMTMCVSLLPISAAAEENTAEEPKLTVEAVSAPVPELSAEAVPSAASSPKVEASAETVRVTFVCEPSGAKISVWDAESKEISPAEDGSYLLTPGRYTYTASCEGYVSAEKVELVIESGAETKEVSVSLEAVKQETEAQETETQDKNTAKASSALNDTVAEEVAEQGSDVIASGECGAEGNNLAWSLDKNGVLTISGTGEMENYGMDAQHPWRDYSAQITAVVIENNVTSVGHFAFAYCDKIRSVDVPASITMIGLNAFLDCSSLVSINVDAKNWNYTSTDGVLYWCDNGEKQLIVCPMGKEGALTIPDNVTEISVGSFSGCSSLTSVTIPASVTKIGGAICNVFGGCTKLASINVDAQNRNYTSTDGVLYDKPMQVLLACPAGKTGVLAIPDGVASIADSAANGCRGLTKLTIPASVNSISEFAFGQCNSLNEIEFCHSKESALKFVTNPNNVSRAFFLLDNQLDTTVIVPDKNNINPAISGYNWADDNRKVTYESSSKPAAEIIDSGECGANGNNLTWTLDKNGVLTISGTGAMKEYSFSEMAPWYIRNSQITNVVIENTVTSVGSFAFSYCGKIRNVNVPAGITTIGLNAFAYCRSLVSIKVDNQNQNYKSANGVLYDNGIKKLIVCPEGKTGDLVIPNGVTEIMPWSFNVCTELTSVTIPDSVTTIGTGAFQGCNGLTSVKIPRNVATIGDWALSGCNNLAEISVDAANQNYKAEDGVLYNKAGTELILCPKPKNGAFTIPDGVKVIKTAAFAGCSRLTAVTLPASLTAIEFTAFAWCGGLTSVAIPNGVTTIGSAAFESCSALKSLTIPASVSSIGTGAFADCKNLKKIEFCHAANIPLTFEEYSNPSAGNGSNTFILNNAANFATTVIVPDKNNINPAISGYNWAGDNRTVEYKSASDSPRHAPNMYVDWITGNAYDVISVDWYCDKDANNTYWAVHNWDGGYAGFQNKDGQHVLLLSLWDLADGTSPTIEYSLSGENGSFGGEGTGKQVFTNYDWQVGKWYTMCIQVSSNNDKSYYTQYVKEENGDWLKTAVISYPITGNKFFGSSVFQEDFTFNNLMRSCRLRNASGRIYGTDTWESWNNCKISNSFFPTDSATWESGVQLNIDFDCNWDNHGDYVWVQSGGEGFDSNGKQIPVEYSLSNPSIPAKSLFDKQDSSSEKVSVNLNEIAADKAASGGFVAIDMNGKVFAADENGSFGAIELGNSETVLAAVSGYNVSDSADVHTMYPTSMEVYLLSDEDGEAKIQHISEFDDLLRYSGCSIRITGKKGIRMITSVDGALKSSLINGGVAGYTLEEYGTLLCFSNEMVNGSLCLDDSYARHNYAYSRAAGADPVFKYSGSMIQYTNVLVGFSLEQCTEDIAMRPYIVLSDAQGNRHTVYGGIVYRSIGYIAYQNRNAFSPTDPAYDYIWDIIHHVYGDKYDTEYKK